MPTYEYQCDACEHNFEEFQSMKDEPLKKCPKCGKKKLRRLIGTGAAIIFKGAGFYQTDYRSDAYRQAAKAEEGSSTSVNKSEKTDKAEKSESTTKTETPAANETPATPPP